jgi:hypothetical protein
MCGNAVITDIAGSVLGTVSFIVSIPSETFGGISNFGPVGGSY